jgi:hypothetical protein
MRKSDFSFSGVIAAGYRWQDVDGIAVLEVREFFFNVADVGTIHKDVYKFPCATLIIKNPVLYPGKHPIQFIHQSDYIVYFFGNFQVAFPAGVILQMATDVNENQVLGLPG